MQSTPTTSITQSCIVTRTESITSDPHSNEVLPNLVAISNTSSSNTFINSSNASSTVATNSRVEKLINCSPTQNIIRQGNSLHIPIGPVAAAAVASSSVSKGKITSSLMRNVQSVQGNISSASIPAQGLIALNRPTTSYVVTQATSTILPKSTSANITTNSFAKLVTSNSSVSNRGQIAVPKPTEITIQTYAKSSAKNIITTSSTQINKQMKTLVSRSSTPTPQNRMKMATNIPASRIPAPANIAPMLLSSPNSNINRKPQPLAPKLITQTKPNTSFTLQAATISGTGTINKPSTSPSINKKTIVPGTTTGTVVTQTICSVRPNPSIVHSNPFVTTTTDTKVAISIASSLLQSPKTQCVVVNSLPLSTSQKSNCYESENPHDPKIQVSSVTGASASYPIASNSRLNISSIAQSQFSAPISLHTPQQQQQQQVFQSSTSLSQLQQPQNILCQSPVSTPNAPVKAGASPRPSILRKREFDGHTVSNKAQRNLIPLLSSCPTVLATVTTLSSPPMSPHSGEMAGAISSTSSTTMSATSSPDRPNVSPESPISHKTDKLSHTTSINDDNVRMGIAPNTSTIVEMSPRKKPRKQQLIATTSIEPKLNLVPLISQTKVPKEPKSSESGNIVKNKINKDVSVKSSSSKKHNISILAGTPYTTPNTGNKHKLNHFLQYSDVKYKEEKKQGILEIANQKQVSRKINGWKVLHLNSQIEDLHETEAEVVDKVKNVLNSFSVSSHNVTDKNLDRITDLMMGNIQRSKVMCDQLKDFQSQLMKVVNHKKHANDIVEIHAKDMKDQSGYICSSIQGNQSANRNTKKKNRTIV